MELVNVGYAILGFFFGIVFHFLIGVIGEQLRRRQQDDVTDHFHVDRH